MCDGNRMGYSTSLDNLATLCATLYLFAQHWNNRRTLYSLYVKGRVLGHKRGKRNSRPNTSLVQLEGVDSKEAAQFYLGKVSRSCGFELGWYDREYGAVGAVEGRVVRGWGGYRHREQTWTCGLQDCLLNLALVAAC